MLTVRQELKRFERKGLGLAMELKTGRGNDRRLYKREKLLAEVEPIFTLIAYRRVAKFQVIRPSAPIIPMKIEDTIAISGKEFTITRTKLRNRHQRLAILYDISVFLRNYCAWVSSQIAIDVLQCFPANCLYGGRNRL